VKPQPLLLRAYHAIAFVAVIVLLGLVCLLVSAVTLMLRPLMPGPRGHRLGRRVISGWFRLYFGLLERLGLARMDLAALDALRHERGLLITPNHPSLLDAMLIASRLEHMGCIMKASVLNSVFFGPVARLSGYISNENLRGILRGVREELGESGQILLFPEGTRSVNPPINPLVAGFGLIAAKADVPVQCVLIETNSPYLGKGWSILRMPRFPLEYRVRLGQRFNPPGRDHQSFVDALTLHLRTELAASPLGGPEPGVPYAASLRRASSPQ
jgi:1-acyl-sn-glycerol-3-phosphate acyltransferase